MKNIILGVAIIFLIITIFYVFLLKRNLRKLQLQIEKKLQTKSNVLLTTESNDHDLQNLIVAMNHSLKEYDDLKNNYENKNNKLKKMMTNIAHDLRTPLTSALGYIDIVLNSNIEEETKIKNLNVIEERLKRLSELVDSFFEFTKILSSDQPIEITQLNLIAVLEKAISNHYDDFSANFRMINLQTDCRKILINSNEILLSRIFDNLIRNAYKHSKGDLEITVNSKKTIKIVFANDLLYADIDVDRLFEEFYTVDMSRTKGNTGLGLAIAKEFAIQLNGTIYAQKRNHKLYIILSFSRF